MSTCLDMVRPSRGRGFNVGLMSAAQYHGTSLRLTRPPSGIFCKTYQCHSMACLDRPGLELGDKIIMPQAAFHEASSRRFAEGSYRCMRPWSLAPIF